MRRLCALAAILLFVGCSDDVAGPPSESGGVISLTEGRNDANIHFWLTMLHNNDGESQLIDAGDGVLADFGGIARFATVVENLKLEAKQHPRAGNGPLASSSMMLAGADATGPPPRNTSNPGAAAILVTSGDNYLAGPEFNLSIQNGIPFFDAVGLDLIGYDALAIGNHEFDFGPDVLADFIESFSFTHPPFLSSNLDFSGEPRLQGLFSAGRIAESTVVVKRGQEIGVIGATTPDLPFISSPRDVIVLGDVAGEIQNEVNKLEMMGINKIILIAHLQSLDEDLTLIPMLDGVDIVVAGGGDELLANPDDLLIPGDVADPRGYPVIATDMDGTPVPVVTTSGNYKYVGRLIVGFNKAGELIAIDDDSGPVRVAGGGYPDAVSPDPLVQSRVVDPVVAGLADLASNVIGVSEVDLDGLRASVRNFETNEGNLIADALKWQAEQLAASFGVAPPDVALQNGGGIRNDSVIPAGNITELQTFSMVPFPNFVTVLENIPRSQFKDILENAVSALPGNGRFAQVSGFSFVYVVSDPVGARVKEVTLDDGTMIVTGGAVVAGADLTVATIDFLAKGGDEYPFGGAPFTTLGVTYQQALSNYIQNGLGGLISAAQYPFGGEGRITELP